MKKQKMFLAAGFMALCLTGCGLFAKMDPAEVSQTATSTSVIVTETGVVKQIIVDTLDQSYYDVTELKQSINTQMADYNSKNGGSVMLSDVSVPDGSKSVRVIIDYKDAAEYSNFNERVLFVGTIDQATAAGYVMPVMVNAKGEAVDAATVNSLSDAKVVVSDEALDIYVAGKIKYRSANTVPASDVGYAASSQGEELSFVVYK